MVDEYKYLGTWVSRVLGPAPHLEKASLKVAYITKKLAPCRYILDTRFNTDLFKMLVVPNVRMLGTVYRLADDNGKEKVENWVKRCYRTFCVLPWTSPNELVALLLGDVR